MDEKTKRIEKLEQENDKLRLLMFFREIARAARATVRKQMRGKA